MDFTMLKCVCIVRYTTLEGKSSNASSEIFLKLFIFSEFSKLYILITKYFYIKKI